MGQTEKLNLPVMNNSRMTGTVDPIMRKMEEINGKVTRKNPKSVTSMSCKLSQTSLPPDHHYTPSKRSKCTNMLNCDIFPLRVA